MPSASRRFIDLIARETDRWPNWEPSIPIQAGDYGTIDKRSGAFEREGNIYDYVAEQDNAFIRGLADKYPVVTGAHLQSYHVNSKHASGGSFVPSAELSITGIATASLKQQWKFDDEQAALLLMNKPRVTKVPNEFLYALQNDKNIRALKNKSVVEGVYVCHAYALYLSNKSNETVKLALVGSAPVLAPAGITAQGSVEASWWTDGCAGLFHEGVSREDVFYPLLQLKQIRRHLLHRRDGSAVDKEGDEAEIWVDAVVPWGELDDDGDEVDADLSD